MRRRGRPPHPDILTPREWEVLALLRDGLSNEAIAQRLGFTLAGAKYHVSEILSKLGVSSREEAAAWQPTERPWWLSAAAPVAALWGKVRLGWLPGTVTASVAVVVAAGAGLLIWGLLRTSGGEGDPTAIIAPIATPGWATPRPLSPPLITTPDPSQGTLHLLDPLSGDVQQLPASGTFSPDGQFLATSGLGGAGLDILTVATGELVRVFDQYIAGMSWSPDGTQLAISVTRDFVEEGDYPDMDEGLFIANADGLGYRKISDLAGSPSWSPRGDWIAVQRNDRRQDAPNGPVLSFTEELFLIRPDGSDKRVLFPETIAGSYEERSLGGLAWSPTGKQLAFVQQKSGQTGKLIIVDIDTGATRTIAEESRSISAIRWSPDEEVIAFGTIRIGNRGVDYYDFSYDVHLVPSDGSAPSRQIANGISPSWSPDSRYLTFIENWCRPPDSARFDLAVYDQTTDTLKTITPPELDIFIAEWSPTGEHIALHTFGEVTGVSIVRADGSDLQHLFTLDSLTHEFGWTPDGSRILFWAPHGGFGLCD